VEMGRYHQSVAAAVAEVDKSIKELQSVEIRSAEDRAAMNIMGGPTRVIVPPEQRVNLLTRGESTLSAAQRIMRTNITAEQEHWTAKAVESGVSEKSLGELWDTLVKAYPENPLMALGEFKAKASVRQLGRDFIHSMVNDGRFSIPLAKEGEKPMGLLTEVPVGYRKLDWAGKRYAVVEPIHEAISQITNPAVIDMGLKNFVTRVLGAPQQWWKIYATSPNPAFHVMNFLGATWNNVLAGVLNPADYLDAAATLYRGRREEAAQVGARFGLTRRVPESTPAGREAQQVLGEAESRAGLGRTGFLFGDISRGRYSPQEIGLTDIPVKHLEPQLYKQAVKDLERGRKLGKKVLTPPPGATKKQAARFYGVTTPRRAAGVVLAAHLNPLSLALFAPEVAGVGRRVGGTIEDLVRLAPFQKYANDPIVRSYMRAFGPLSVDGMRHTGFTKAEQRTMYDIGAAISKHFQFDYSTMTHAERVWMRSFFPFWTFYKKNMALQVQQLIKQPRTYATTMRLMNYSDEHGQDLGQYEGLLPQYFETLQAFQVPVPNAIRDKLGLSHDQPLFLNPKLPFASLNLIPPLWDILRDNRTPSTRRIAETFAPMFGQIGPLAPMPFPGAKLVLEGMTGWNFGMNRPIDFQRVQSGDYRHSYVPASGVSVLLSKIPGLNKIVRVHDTSKGKMIDATTQYWIDNLSAPYLNNLGQVVPVTGDTETERNKKRALLVSWGIGVRLMPFDALRLSRNAAYTLKDLLESKQADLKLQGKELNDEDYNMLSMVNDDLEIINDAYDARYPDYNK